MGRRMSSKFHESLASSATSQMNSVVSWIEGRVNSVASFTERKVRQSLWAGAYAAGSVVLMYLLMFWTVVLYFILYWMFIPAPMHFEAPLYFDVDPALDGPVRFDLPANVPFEFPTAKVHFASYDQQWIELRESAANKTARRVYPGMHENPLVLGEFYDVSLDMTFPETPQNLEIGTFMVETELLFAPVKDEESSANTPLVRSRRPLSLPYRTWLSNLVRDVVFLPVRFFTGWFAPERSVSLLMINDWHEPWDYSRLPTGVKVTLSDPRLNINRATIKFDIKLYGFRYWMYYWFWTTFLLCVAVALTMESGTAFFVMLYRWLVPVTKKRVQFKFPEFFSDEEEAEEEEEEEVEEEEEGKATFPEGMEGEEEEEQESLEEEEGPAFEEQPTAEPESPKQGERFMMARRPPTPKEATTATFSRQPDEESVGTKRSGHSREGSTELESAGYGTPKEEEDTEPSSPEGVVQGEEEKRTEPPTATQGKRPPSQPTSGQVAKDEEEEQPLFGQHEETSSSSSGEKSPGSSDNDMVMVGEDVAPDDFGV